MEDQKPNRNALQKTSRLLGLIAITFGIAGGMFKVLHWPGGSFIMLIAHLCLMLHLLFYGLSCLNGKKRWHKVWILSTTFWACTIVLGLFFKLMHWPGASFMLVFGPILFLFMGYLPLSIIERQSHGQRLYTDQKFQHAIIFSLMILMMLWGRKPARSILQSSKATTLNTIRDNADILDEINVYKSINPQPEIDREATALLDNIRRLSQTILITCGEKQSDDLAADVNQMQGLDRYDEPSMIMAGSVTSDAMESEQFNLLIQVAKIEDTWKNTTGNELSRIERPLIPSTYLNYESSNDLFQFQYVPQIMAINQLVEIEQMVLNMYLDMYIVKSLKQPNLEDTDEELESNDLESPIETP